MIVCHDVAGRMKQFDSANTIHITQLYDGDGLPAYRLETHPGLIDRATIYYVRSSVLGGQTITELKANGGKRRTYVYAGGGEIARQEKIGNAPDSVTWMTRDPITGDEGSITRDPLGGYLGNELSVLEPDYAALKGDATTHDTDADPFDSGSGCTLDGVPIDCSLAIGLANHGGAVQAPLKSIVPVTYLGQRTLAVFQATNDGYEGFVPVTGRYTGEGHIASINPPRLFRRGQLSGDTDLRRLNGVGDDDPEASLARSTGLVGWQSDRDKAGRKYPFGFHLDVTVPRDQQHKLGDIKECGKFKAKVFLSKVPRDVIDQVQITRFEQDHTDEHYFRVLGEPTVTIKGDRLTYTATVQVGNVVALNLNGSEAGGIAVFVRVPTAGVSPADTVTLKADEWVFRYQEWFGIRDTIPGANRGDPFKGCDNKPLK